VFDWNLYLVWLIEMTYVFSHRFQRIWNLYVSIQSLQPPPPPSGSWHHHSRSYQITHNDAPQSVGLLWTSDQFVAKTATWQHITNATDRHPCPRRDLNPQSQQASGRRLNALDRAATGTGLLHYYYHQSFNILIIFRKIIAVSSENIIALFGKMQIFLAVAGSVTCKWYFKGLSCGLRDAATSPWSLAREFNP